MSVSAPPARCWSPARRTSPTRSARSTRLAWTTTSASPGPDELRAVVRDQLTEYVLESDVDPLPYVSVLDGVRVMEAIR